MVTRRYGFAGTEVSAPRQMLVSRDEGYSWALFGTEDGKLPRAERCQYMQGHGGLSTEKSMNAATK